MEEEEEKEVGQNRIPPHTYYFIMYIGYGQNTKNTLYV